MRVEVMTSSKMFVRYTKKIIIKNNSNKKQYQIFGVYNTIPDQYGQIPVAIFDNAVTYFEHGGDKSQVVMTYGTMQESTFLKFTESIPQDWNMDDLIGN